jgi:hypothetical protein
MLRGGSYVDKDGFYVSNKGINKMDVTDINQKKGKGTLGQAG